MYNSSYSRATVGLETKKIHKTKKGKSCGYYMRIVFFFSSLIQSLIIVSLVLFLVYGQPEKTAEEKRVEELELAFNKISADNTKLRKDNADLTGALKAKTGEKDAADKEITKLKNDLTIKTSSFQRSLAACEASKAKVLSTRNPPSSCPPSNNNQNGDIKTLNSALQQQRELYGILMSNFSQTAKYLKIDLDNAVKDKNEHHSQVIQLTKENMNLKSQLDVYTKKCKEDFAESLKGIQTVTSAFLTKIDNFFTHSVTFHLTCAKQEEQMGRIRSNCSSLSRQVEDKFQSYLNIVGEKVSSIQKQSSRLEVENVELTSELDKCKADREKVAAESSKKLQDAQQKYDKEQKQLLEEKSRLRNDKEQIEVQLRNGCTQQPKPAGQPPGMATSGRGR
ncbi:plasmalemma vesicle associated protein b [Carassius carassius]|uniref:plasmalemma vesicle associated protein b n=1 Tax=Carassius carassius TaxID=217509 RepID=UPI0028691356|nr:plasmalemma vesicle associated protein b [Carassius carassius]